MQAFLTHFVFDVFAGRAAIDADRQHHGFPMAVIYVPAHSVFDVFGFKMAAFIAPPPPYFPQFRFHLNTSGMNKQSQCALPNQFQCK